MEKHEDLVDDVKVAVRKLPLIILAAFIQWAILLVFGMAVPMVLLYIHNQLLDHQPLLFTDITVLLIILSLQLIFGLYLFYLFIFYLPIILTENQKSIASLKKSVYLVWGKWWSTVWVQLTPWLLYLFVLMGLKYGLHFDIHIYFIAPLERFSWLSTGIHIIIFALFIPWIAATLLVQLRDLEIRKRI